jgi:cytochrome c biogenesis protein CcmG, thiol:disulfide interchange protein DsbE
MRSENFASRRAVLKACAAVLATPEVLLVSPARANDIRVGATAPPATLVTLGGEKISTPSLLGNVVILTFWATWCEPCRDELPLLSRYFEQHAKEGLRVLGFGLDDSDKLAEVRRVGRTLSFPVGLLANSSAPGYGRIWKLPVNFTIDRAGRLVRDGWKEKNPSWTAESLQQVVTPLLQAAAR